MGSVQALGNVPVTETLRMHPVDRLRVNGCHATSQPFTVHLGSSQARFTGLVFGPNIGLLLPLILADSGQNHKSNSYVTS